MLEMLCCIDGNGVPVLPENLCLLDAASYGDLETYLNSELSLYTKLPDVLFLNLEAFTAGVPAVALFWSRFTPTADADDVFTIKHDSGQSASQYAVRAIINHVQGAVGHFHVSLSNYDYAAGEVAGGACWYNQDGMANGGVAEKSVGYDPPNGTGHFAMLVRS